MKTARTRTHRALPSLVYSTTQWQEHLFQKRAEGSRLATALGSTAQALKLQGGKDSEARSFGLEVFSRLYDDPSLLPEDQQNQDTPWAGMAHEILSGLEEFQSLSALTASDPDMSALGTVEMLRALEPKLEELVQEAKKEQERAEQGESQPGEPAEGGGEGPVVKRFQVSAQDRIRAALRGAARDAAQVVGEAKTALEGIAPGLGHAPPTQDQLDPRRLKLAEAITNNRAIRRILELAGTLERIARAEAQTRKTPDSYEEIHDLERGGDLARILPSELAALKGPRVLRLLAIQKVVDRTALQYRLEGKEKLGRGHMVVALDESGSMGVPQNAGTREVPNVWARAIGLASLRIARMDRRPVSIVGFNHGLTTVHFMDREGNCFKVNPHSGEATPFPGGLPAMALEVISRGCSGGTSFDAPISYAMRLLKEEIRGDLVFVTDGESTTSPATMEALAEAKKVRGLRVYGVEVGAGRITAAMKAVCDVAISFIPEVGKMAKLLPA